MNKQFTYTIIAAVISLALPCQGATQLSGSNSDKHFHFHGRTIDQYGYVDWVGEVPAAVRSISLPQKSDQQVLTDCLSIMDQHSGDALLYLAIKASVAGYRLRKPHLVAIKLNAIIENRVPVLWVKDKDIQTIDTALIVAAKYVNKLCGNLATRDPHYNKWQSVENTLLGFGGMLSAYPKVPRTRPLISYIHAVCSFIDEDYNATRKELNWLMVNYPHEVGFYLLRARSFRFGVLVTKGDPADNCEIDFEKSNAIMELAHKKWPTNPRVWYMLGSGLQQTNPERARNLLTRYLAAKEGTIEPEIQASKRILARISK
ncbi:hypothetical protein QPK87_37230 [Kamptonema cortianum]|nr:hypothetical protein [Kamptonema cortianum]